MPQQTLDRAWCPPPTAFEIPDLSRYRYRPTLRQSAAEGPATPASERKAGVDDAPTPSHADARTQTMSGRLTVDEVSSDSRHDRFPMPIVEHGGQDKLLTNSETRIKAGEVHNAGQPNWKHIQEGTLQAQEGLADAITPNPDGAVLGAQHDDLSSQRRRADVDSRPENLKMLEAAALKLCTRLKIPAAYRYIIVGLQEIIFHPGQVSIYPKAPHLLLGTLAMLVFHRLSPSPDGMPVGAIHWNRVGPRRLKTKCRTVFRIVAEVMGVDFNCGWRRLYRMLLGLGAKDTPVTDGWVAVVPPGGGRGGTEVQ